MESGFEDGEVDSRTILKVFRVIELSLTGCPIPRESSWASVLSFMRVAFWKDFNLEKRDDEIKEENDDGKMPRILVISDQICPFNPSLTN